MSCTLFDQRPDWKAYALNEMDPGARREAEAHSKVCQDCYDELAGLQITLGALATLREEEIPRRIAFVSDKVFEPRWWQSFLRPSFAAAGLIAAAILVHGFVRPVSTGAVPADTAAITKQIQQQVDQQIEREVAARVDTAVSARIDAAVTKAVADTERREEQKTTDVLAATEKRFTDQRRADFATAAANYDMLSKQLTKMYAVNTGIGVR